MSDVQETIELATLDKEMAEEKVSLSVCLSVFVLVLPVLCL